MNVLVACYSLYEHTLKMAGAARDGACRCRPLQTFENRTAQYTGDTLGHHR